MNSQAVNDLVELLFRELEGIKGESDEAERNAGMKLAIDRYLKTLAQKGGDLLDVHSFLSCAIVMSGNMSAKDRAQANFVYWLNVNRTLITISQHLEIMELFFRNSIVPTIRKYFPT